MSTEYVVLKEEVIRAEVQLVVVESSSHFDLLAQVCSLDGLVAEINLGEHLTAAQLAEVAIGLLRSALYNVPDPERFKRWLKVRVDEADTSTARTRYEEVK